MKDTIIKLAYEYQPGNIEQLTDNKADDLPTRIISIVNGIIGVLAIICVIVIIIGGVSYMTSAGDAGKVKKAKDTILYALIGLIICALAAAIVNFVITKAIGV